MYLSYSYKKHIHSLFDSFLRDVLKMYNIGTNYFYTSLRNRYTYILFYNLLKSFYTYLYYRNCVLKYLNKLKQKNKIKRF